MIISQQKLNEKMIGFEYIAKDCIKTIEFGCDAEEISENAYNQYVLEVKHTGRKDLELIPSTYYEALKRAEPIVSNISSFKEEVRKEVPEQMMIALKGYQIECVYRMVSQRRLLNACMMGTGKTIQAICSILMLRAGKTDFVDLVICPGCLRSNWHHEFTKWAPSIPIQVIAKVGNTVELIQEYVNKVFTFTGVTIISYEIFSKLAGSLKQSERSKKYFNTIVCDESQYLKDSESARVRNSSAFIQNAKNLFLMTGTPSPNRPVELYTQLRLIDSTTFTTKRIFTDRYCYGHVDRWGKYDSRGASNIRELSLLLSKYMVRVLQPDYIMPSVTRTVTDVQPSNLPVNHDILLREVFNRLNEGNDSTAQVQAAISQLFRDTAAAKIFPVLNFLQERLPFGEKVILFCVHMVMFDAVRSFLRDNNIKFIGINGGMPVQARDDAVSRFLSEDEEEGADVALLTLGTCSTGINLVPVRRAIFLELHWTPATIHQAECRINRIGGASELTYEYIIAARTLDKYVYNMLFKKNSTVSNIIDQGKENGTFDFTVKP